MGGRLRRGNTLRWYSGEVVATGPGWQTARGGLWAPSMPCQSGSGWLDFSQLKQSIQRGPEWLQGTC